MSRQCKFNEAWQSGRIWLKRVRGSESSAHCSLCKVDFSVSHGLAHVKQHEGSEKHKRLCPSTSTQSISFSSDLTLNDTVDRIEYEAILYKSCSDILSEWYMTQNEIGSVAHKRIDQYWNKVFSLTDHNGQKKFPALKSVVISTIVIPHGNATVESEFSLNNDVLTPKRLNLSDQSVASIGFIKSFVYDHYSNDIKKVPITRDMITAFKKSRDKYQNFLAEQKEREQALERERKRKIEMESDLQKKRKRSEIDEQLKMAEARKVSAKEVMDMGLRQLEDCMAQRKPEKATLMLAKTKIDQGRKDIESAEKDINDLKQKLESM